MRPKKEITRTKKITITLTSLESLLLESYAKKSHYKKSVLAREVLVKFLKNEQLKIKIVPEEIKELRHQIFKQGSNLNQITKRINQDKYISTANQVLLNKQLTELILVMKSVELKTK